jgi:hypothetical protein
MSVFQAAESLISRAKDHEWTNDFVSRPGPNGEPVRQALSPGEPCAGLIYDVEAGAAHSELFEVERHWNDGRTLVVTTRWTPDDGRRLDPASLLEDFYATFSYAFSEQTFVDRQPGQDAMIFQVISGNESHGHLLEFRVIGDAADGVRRYLQGLRQPGASGIATTDSMP